MKANLFRSRLSMLERLALANAVKIESLLQELISAHYRIDRKPETLCRLLNLRGATLKHRIGLREVLQTLLEHYQRKVGEGVPIKTLTGPVAMEYLSSEIARRYPSGEQFESWRVQRRLKAVSRFFSGNYSADPAQFPETYLDNLMKGRRGADQLMALRRRRKYRGNPWIS